MDIKKIIEEEVRTALVGLCGEEKPIEESRWHPKDDLLSGITFEDLIITLQSNERNINAAVVTKTFDTMVKEALLDARSELKDNMDKIISEAK